MVLGSTKPFLFLLRIHDRNSYFLNSLTSPYVVARMDLEAGKKIYVR